MHLGSQDVRRVQNNVKTLWNYNPVPSPPPQKKTKKIALPIPAKGPLKTKTQPARTIPHENQSPPQIP